jgi:Protein of unknown function (DUF2628)
MVTYTLHVPEGTRPGDPDGLEKAELIKDGFSWGAFIFTFLWFFANRLWIAGLGVLVIVIAFAALLNAVDVRPLAGTAAQLLLLILIGLEANSLKRWTRARRGRPTVAVVAADDYEAAEEKAISQWLAASATVRPAAFVAPARGAAPALRGPEPVIGLFPDAERGR